MLSDIYIYGVVQEVCLKTQGREVKLLDWDAQEWFLSQRVFADDRALVVASLKQIQC